MDAFFASVMVRDRPDLADVPVIVGGGHRGVVLSATYLARRDGVRSGMPMGRARRACPDAVVLPPDSDAFDVVSSSVMEIFRRFTPIVEVASLDEAFLDVRSVSRQFGSPRAVAEQIRAMVHDEQRITCSVGVAASPLMAKLASQRAKPDGVVVVPPAEVTRFLHPLAAGDLWGVGEKTADALGRLGLHTVADVAHTPVRVLQRALGPARGRQVHDLAWGHDDRRITPRRGDHEPDRSMGADETFHRDTDDRAVIVRELLRLSTRLGRRLRTAQVAGRTVTIRVRFADFTTITRSRTLPEATDVTREIHQEAVRLYDALGLQRARVRLVGVRLEGLVPRSSVQRQLVLGEREHGWSEADRAMDRAAARFGGTVIRPASLLG